MSKILLVGRYEDRPGYETPELLESAIGSVAGNDLNFSHFEDLQIFAAKNEVSIIDPKNQMDIKEYDGVFLFGWYSKFKDLSYAAAYYLDYHKVKFFNTEALHQRSSGKVSQAVIFGLNGIQIPKTSYKINTDDEFIQLSQKWLNGYPLIAKQTDGNKGKNNHLIKSDVGLIDVINQQDDGVTLIFQQYIPNTGDYRVILAGDELKLVLHRYNKSGNTHLHNTSLGAEGKLVPLEEMDPEIKQQCVVASQLMRREFSGLDIIQHSHTGDWYLLESNNMPQVASGLFGQEHINAFKDFLTNNFH